MFVFCDTGANEFLDYRFLGFYLYSVAEMVLDMKRVFFCFLLLFLSLPLFSQSFLKLKNGKELYGELVETDKDQKIIKFKTSKGELKVFKFSEVFFMETYDIVPVDKSGFGGVKDDTSDDTMVADSLENKGTAEIRDGFTDKK